MCACQNVVDLLSELGAEHAKKLAASGGSDHPEDMSKEDWLAHMEEEERLFFPLLTLSWRENLAADHDRFRHQLAEAGAIETEDARRHAGLEDWLVREHVKWRAEFRKEVETTRT
jgi:hypothetical protein